MEFGLQKAEKMESPVLVGNPRKRIEAKAYRARDRMDGGWFRHDAGTPDNSPHVSPAASPLRATSNRHQQVDGNLPRMCTHCSRSKFQQHTVAAGVKSTPLNGEQQSPKKVHLSDAAARFQQQIYPNCKDWYKHEHTIIISDVDEGEHNGKDKCHSPTPTWWYRDQHGSNQFSPRSRRACAEAEEYWKRNHAGSTKDWYRHEHTLVEDKENEFADVNMLDTSPQKEVGVSDADKIIAPNGHGHCTCGLNVSPAMEIKSCQKVLTERF